MMAAGQQDCGQCGYDCKQYADALFGKKEARLNLCIPGGKETARMLKTLHAEIGTAPARQRNVEPVESRCSARRGPAARATTGRGQHHLATLPQQERLRKETWHIEFDLTSAALDYTVGDAFGLYPAQRSGAGRRGARGARRAGRFPIGGRALREVLMDGVSLAPAPDMLFQLYSYITGGERRKKAKALGDGEDPDGDVATLDVLAAIEKFSGVRPDPEAFIEALDPLQPRLYSIRRRQRALGACR